MGRGRGRASGERAVSMNAKGIEAGIEAAMRSGTPSRLRAAALVKEIVGAYLAAAEPQRCTHTGLICVPGCDGKTACAGMHIPINQWPVAEEPGL